MKLTDENIEKVSRRMCNLMGLNPMHDVMVGELDILTHSELLTTVNPTCMAFKVPLWKTFRKHAETAIAGNIACSELDE